jgi:hypothetical protein
VKSLTPSSVEGPILDVGGLEKYLRWLHVEQEGARRLVSWQGLGGGLKGIQGSCRNVTEIHSLRNATAPGPQ